MARIGHFCSDCGEELQAGEEYCPQHLDTPINSVEVDDYHHGQVPQPAPEEETTMAYTETAAARAYREAMQAQMAARLRQFEMYRALRQGPMSFGDALGALCVANARQWNLTLNDTTRLLETVARFVFDH